MTASTATTDKRAAFADAFASMEEFRAQLIDAIAWEDTNMTPWWVVGFPQHLTYCKVNETLPDGRVKNMATTGILFATRMDRNSAERATACGNIRNGLGEWADAVLYVNALRGALAHVEDTIRMLRDHSATA